jgi:hypothetical protein
MSLHPGLNCTILVHCTKRKRLLTCLCLLTQLAQPNKEKVEAHGQPLACVALCVLRQKKCTSAWPSPGTIVIPDVRKFLAVVDQCGACTSRPTRGASLESMALRSTMVLMLVALGLVSVGSVGYTPPQKPAGEIAPYPPMAW